MSPRDEKKKWVASGFTAIIAFTLIAGAASASTL
jgi:hypothetical protein